MQLGVMAAYARGHSSRYRVCSSLLIQQDNFLFPQEAVYADVLPQIAHTNFLQNVHKKKARQCLCTLHRA